MFIYDEEVAVRMRDLYLADEQHSTSFTDIPKRVYPSFMKRLGESVVRMLSPLM